MSRTRGGPSPGPSAGRGRTGRRAPRGGPPREAGEAGPSGSPAPSAEERFRRARRLKPAGLGLSAASLAAAAALQLHLSAARADEGGGPLLPPLPPDLGVRLRAAVVLAAGAGAVLWRAAEALGWAVEVADGALYLQQKVADNGLSLAALGLTDRFVEVRDTGDARGRGAFARLAIGEGTHIGDYRGELIDNETYFRRYPDGFGEYCMVVGRDAVLDGREAAAGARFTPAHINHSRDRANVARFCLRGRRVVRLHAARDIEAGEELLLDYGRAYWRGREAEELP